MEENNLRSWPKRKSTFRIYGSLSTWSHKTNTLYFAISYADDANDLVCFALCYRQESNKIATQPERSCRRRWALCKCEVNQVHTIQRWRIKSIALKKKLLSKWIHRGSIKVDDTRSDVNIRISKEWTVLNEINAIWESRMTWPYQLKRKFFRVTIESALIYGSRNTLNNKDWTVHTSECSPLDLTSHGSKIHL